MPTDDENTDPKSGGANKQRTKKTLATRRQELFASRWQKFKDLPHEGRTWALVFGGFLILTGMAILTFALYRFISADRGISLVVPGCGLLVAGVASVVATLGVDSWANQRERERAANEYERRERIYEAITQFMVRRYTGSGYDEDEDARLRATAALWASPEVLGRLAEWQQSLTLVLDRSVDAGNGKKKMSGEDTELTKRNLANAILAMRVGLASASSKPVDPVIILRSIFNEETPKDLFGQKSSA